MEDRFGVWRSNMRNGDFQERDVWDVLNESGSSRGSNSVAKTSSVSPVPRRLPSAVRMIPGANTNINPIHEPSVVQQQSAPVNIPDWSKIYGKIPKMASNSTWHDDDDGVNDDEDDDDRRVMNDDDDDDDDDDDFEKLPPHEWIARKLARSQISSFSVCEGLGRTLKGRDLSRVRNAVLTKTGFLE
ncbi:protein S40-7-like [Malania oleifera]|uniref:protein S40-7-like n=1 Tax=Malania oleifera TaxID=397392 RepID=UPI0025AE7FD3|nr:protein S40-7-like [Malania oleifera]XP_057972213.1 protein S40-7-like [Malania oleifera]